MPPDTPPVVEVRKVSYTYPGTKKAAVDDVEFEIAPGEIFGFLGPSGAGKSTTQKILIGILQEYRGRVKVFGRDLSEWGKEYYERIGVSFETPNHYLKLTARENLEYFRSLYQVETAEPHELLDAVNLAEDADRRVAEYSKGMRGRLTLARALVNRPELLFLDEPTTGLDPVTSRRVRDLIRSVRDEGATVFLTTHSMTVADELCDRVAFIVEGRLELIDAPRTLKMRHGQRTVRVELETNGRLSFEDFPLTDLADNPRFLELLRSERLQTIHTQETTLEDIFIKVTGRTLT